MKVRAFGVLVLVLVCGFALTANAQIGSGWTSYSPSFTTQVRGCGSISGSTFKLTCSSSSGEQRAERRYQNVTSAYRQFEGTVKVTSLGGDRISLKQTYQEGSGAWNMVGVKKPGTLYEVKTGANLASYTIGSSVRINTITNVSGRSVQVYINGSLKETIKNGTPPFYDKLGAYRTSSGHGPISVTWSGIRFWRK